MSRNIHLSETVRSQTFSVTRSVPNTPPPPECRSVYSDSIPILRGSCRWVADPPPPPPPGGPLPVVVASCQHNDVCVCLCQEMVMIHVYPILYRDHYNMLFGSTFFTFVGRITYSDAWPHTSIDVWFCRVQLTWQYVQF